ncbi:hypothetical protein CON65_00995 [Bacillus pseudomycoides]|uniref:Uncharacterized protein n=1 Tax=Bacillus pseudomycoides TaxID=64104 RepID=A0AA91VG12_9BACI|nr:MULTISPECIES: DUF5694 domain-containing protein [Bacillus]PEB51091.1 hypothetical protein COO03_18775 [Bacillus sp. AFS098217]PED84389.1 hypothetical protein CON65_00995 [Bacillus pseudomycoides]PEU13267.1 hypothetical protein CN524_11890 [Bacillus sp. AFS019443]PEU13879.1 hypothetical protein CN525_18875 [Bacillus sp. AFS014408]PFW60007.1 hypothetical protein COL20_23590 [Bacillus sp. AFS075034]
MEEHKPKVLVLGSCHMSEHEELLSDRRQAEIEELVSFVQKFSPTKIAVEVITDENDRLNEQFKQYKLGTYKLVLNEIDQIGFRMAANLQHEQIYAVDWMGGSDVTDVWEVHGWAKKNQPQLFEEIFGWVPELELTDDKSVLDFYKELNDPVLLNKLHKLYVNMARIGDFGHYVGMEWLTWWYKRNLIMYSNIARLIDSPEERILFIVGSSHCSIVSKFLEEGENCVVVSPQNYLYENHHALK